MKFEKRWHLYVFIMSVVLIVFSFIYALLAWNDLPSRIPIHFNFSGEPDAWGNKNIFSLFFPFIMQIIFTPLMLFLYFKPQYMSMPTSLLLTTLPEKQKTTAFGLIRNVAVFTLLWLNLIFAFISYMIVSGAKEEALPYQGWILLFLVAVMLFWLVWYNIYIYRIIKKEFDINPFSGKKVKKNS
jgi:uncharacterized membrane protein